MLSFRCNIGHNFYFWVRKFPWRRDRFPTPVFLGLPGGSDAKYLLAIQETWVQSLGWDDPLEKGMATHSSVPAWRIPWTGEPRGLRSMRSQRAGHDWATEHSAAEATVTDFLLNALKNEEKILFLDFWHLTVSQLASHRTCQREGTMGTSHCLLVPDPRRGFHGLCQHSFNQNTVQSQPWGAGHTTGWMQRQGPLEGCWPWRGLEWGLHCWYGKGVLFSQAENLDSALQRKFFYCSYKASSVIKAQSHQVSLPRTPGPQDPCSRSLAWGGKGHACPKSGVRNTFARKKKYRQSMFSQANYMTPI